MRDAGFRTYGKRKHHRDDLPQIVIGMAVTRGGIPVRVWSWPGNTSDSKLIRQVTDDMRDWSLARIVRVADRGFTSAGNRRFLQRGAGHYIIGEKLRSNSPEVRTALSRQGRYATCPPKTSPSATNKLQRDLLAALDLTPPRTVIEVTVSNTDTTTGETDKQHPTHATVA